MSEQLVVLIATAGRADLLGRTLDSLARARLPEAYRETIVVENGPQGGAEQVVAQQPPQLAARYEYVQQPGKSNALNLAIERLPDDCLVFMTDDDVRFDQQALTPFAEAMRGIDSGVFFGGAMDVDFVEPPPEWLTRWLPLDSRPFGPNEYRRGSSHLVFLGCNWAAFAGDLRRAGGFDRRLGPGGTSGGMGQEADMQQKLLGIGVEPRFLAASKVWHYVPAERCSPDYVIHRHYRIGILDATRRQSRPTNRWGIPLWHWRRVARSGCRYLATRLHPNMATRFDAKRAMYYEMGQARGAWNLAHNGQRAAAP